jgi:hypothetical protein
MPPSILHYLITGLRQRVDRVRSGELDRGALSLEWIVIAVGLVVAAGAVAAVALKYVNDNSGKITAP